MIEYPKWQENIRAAQAKARVAQQQHDDQQKTWDYEEQTSRLDALGKLLAELDLNGIAYRNEDGSCGYIIGLYQFYVWEQRGNYTYQLAIRPVLSDDDSELLEKTEISWTDYYHDPYTEASRLSCKWDSAPNRPGDRRMYVQAYTLRSGTDEESRDQIKVWIADEIDRIDAAVTHAKDIAAKKRVIQQSKETATIEVQPIPVDPDANKAIEALMVLFRKEIAAQISEHCGYYHEFD